MNLLWLLLGGIFTAVEYLISSLLMMITIIGIPFGIQTLKLAGLALWPFGKEVRSGQRSGGCLYVLMNILWIFLGGIWICLSHLVFGAILYHYYWYSLWFTTLQIGGFGIVSFWKRYCDGIELKSDSPLLITKSYNS